MMPTRFGSISRRLAQQLDAVHAGHHQVGSSRSNSPVAEGVRGGLAGSDRPLGLEAFFGQRLAEGAHQLDLVIDNEQADRGRGAWDRHRVLR